MNVRMNSEEKVSCDEKNKMMKFRQTECCVYRSLVDAKRTK